MKRDITINYKQLLPILLMLCLIIYFTLIILKFPAIGIEVREQNSRWIIEEVHTDGWASKQHINEGDILLQINGNNPGNHATVKWFNRAEMANSITVLNQEMESKTYQISYNHVNQQYMIHFMLPFLFAMLILGFSIFLYWKRKEGESVTILLYFLLTIGVFYLSSFISVRGDLIGWGLNTITLSGSLILFLHFIKDYLLRYGLSFINTKLLAVLYVLNFIILPIIIASMIFLKLNNYAKIFELIILLLLICFVFYHLARSNVTYKDSQASGFLKILWVTLFLAFSPALFFYVIPNIFSKDELVPPEIVLAFLIIIPIAFVYLQMTEKLFDIEFLLGRLRYYTLLSFPASVAIVFLLNFVVTFNPLFKLSVLTFIILFTCITLSFYLKEYLDYKIRRHLFTPKYDFETSFFNFYQKTKNQTRVDYLIRSLMNEIEDALAIKKAFNMKINKASKEIERVSMNKDAVQFPLFVEDDLKKINWEYQQIGSFIELTNGFVLMIGEDPTNKNIIYASTKDANRNLNIKEKIWLETLAYFSSILFENFQLIEDLLEKLEDYSDEKNSEHGKYPYWLSRLLFELSEKERMNLSIDLHDSVLQDQLQMLRNIDDINERTTDKPIKSDLLDLKGKMLDSIYMIRETCYQLHPPFLSELGIIKSIQHLIDQTKLRSNFIVKAELDESIQHLSREIELALYRVVQELLSNAMKHSEATEVQLSLTRQGQELSLFYKDNGVGMVLHADHLFQTMGIHGIKERIHSIDGTINLHSAIGGGMQVSITVRGEAN